MKINDITTIRTSSESHLHWIERFHRNSSFFRVYADFKADNEKDNSSIGNKLNDICKQNPVCNGYRIVSELEAVSKNGYYKSFLGYENVDWFVGEIIKLEKKRKFWFKNTKKDIIKIKKIEKIFKIPIFANFVKKVLNLKR